MNKITWYFCVFVVVADILALVYFGGRFILTGSVMPHEEKFIAVVDLPEEGETVVAEVEEPTFDRASFVPNIEKGAAISGKCKACHTFEQGGSNKIGPNLWGIFEKPIASTEEFSYSAAFEAKKGQVTWTAEELEAFLKKPKDWEPKTKMSFPGLKKEEDLINMVEWLKTLK